MRRLHLGCGKVYLSGWTNVDLFDHVKADYYCDITRLPYENASFDLIYASHVLEHCHRNMVMATLCHWRDLLASGGVLRLAVPDFGAVCRRYIKTGELKELMGLLYGGQNHPRNHHLVTFDKKTLNDYLIRAGFLCVREWDWRKTDHAEYDDYSQCYLPHLNKTSGELMSLNLEAVK